MSRKLVGIRILFAVLLLAASLATMPVVAEEGEPQHGMGVLLSPPGDYPVLDVLVSPQALVSSVDLSAALPPVGDQGIEPTCTLWAVGYYYKTLQEQRERAWGTATGDHQFSPSYLYSLSVGCGALQPVAIPSALEVVRAQGAATMQTFPLRSFGQCRAPTAEELQAAQPYRALSYGNLFMFQGKADINRLKAHLAGGDAFVLSVPVYDSFYFYHGQSPVIGVPAASERLWGHHAILIVGYDDSLGAFKLVNSWGTRWGNGGFAYLSYDFVRTKGWEAWAMVDATNTAPMPVVTATPQPTATATPMPPTPTPVQPTRTPVPPTPTPQPKRVVSTLVLQQGLSNYRGASDSFIESRGPTTNYDASRTLRVSDDGSVTALLRFDVSVVPSKAEVVEAKLELYVDVSAQNLSLSAFEVARSWASKEADWRKARNGNPWGAPGCNDTATDRTSAPVAAAALTAGKGWRSIDVTAAVRRWVSGQANNGLVLRGQGGTSATYVFLSSEHTSASGRPKLTIKYQR